MEIGEGQQKIKIVRTNQQSDLRGGVPANQISPCLGTSLSENCQGTTKNKNRPLQPGATQPISQIFRSGFAITKGCRRGSSTN